MMEHRYKERKQVTVLIFKIEQNDVIIDESQRKITIYLLLIELLDSNINVERSETFNENFKSKILGTFEIGAIDKWVPLDIIEKVKSFCDEIARERLTKEIEDHIMFEDNYSEMKALAERYIRNLLSVSTEKGYTVEISFKE